MDVSDDRAERSALVARTLVTRAPTLRKLIRASVKHKKANAI